MYPYLKLFHFIIQLLNVINEYFKEWYTLELFQTFYPILATSHFIKSIELRVANYKKVDWFSFCKLKINMLIVKAVNGLPI